MSTDDETTRSSRNPLGEQSAALGADPLGRTVSQGVAGATVVSSEQTGHVQTVERTRVSAGYIWLLIFGVLGTFIALVAPIGISLSLRVQELAPDNVEVLGVIVGLGAATAAISNVLVGMWSDRTRSRFGRRRPFALGGTLVGFAALAIIAGAPTIPIVIVGWIFAQLGWSSAMTSLLMSQADRLPEEQRGKVAGLSGFVQMFASVLGVAIASAFIGNNYLVFLVPGTIGAIAMLLWVFLVKEPDSRGIQFEDKMTFAKVLQGMVFNPKKHPDFAWNWLGRLVFNFGVTFATTFTTLFFASRLSTGGKVADIGGLITILALAGVLATAVGALGGGFLSDKLKRRRIFVLGSGVVFTIGALIMAFGGSSLPLLVTGAVLTNLGLGVFSAVDQAIVLDVLPEIDTEAGRYLGVNGYSTQVAQALAPFAATGLILVGVSGSERNYGLLFIVAAVCTLIGGTIVQLKVRGSN